MRDEFVHKGYTVVRNFLTPDQVAALNKPLRQFHSTWLAEHADVYARGAVNSAYITSTRFRQNPARQELFTFLASHRFMVEVEKVVGDSACFMNTQLFFDPHNTAQNNYWHRDSQYHLNLREQQESLRGPQVVHFRIPLVDERGIELVPGSHKRWDTAEELDVRLERNHRQRHDSLSSGAAIALKAGDLCVFSAAMIHRGLYGLNRFALDILMCDPAPELLQFVDNDCLPTQQELTALEHPAAFLRTLTQLNACGGASLP
ncbi:MAG TPA: phytanoyl-CoA dioxygenase family protein [Cellvibrionaceae bacterium]|nr:phytanoyl-CoA dioxygenase family protein [Cellvibrionaceae bacterium]HMW48358.1 phytanoyl-CoA dioxygenase family protein [Cellvibrionaceae bacterium]HMW70671.1 phytanoyl-CoA dioxygenase family protein [Cellvibrionaceae bacterium]HMY40113.1 phytanoyl-CoA dioxygenase family protein [Marinagarivorans sp.]HNG60572.1 phytanoyl-CoA dioxygenase family protein [Cellvibrionaceae bacterium]